MQLCTVTVLVIFAFLAGSHFILKTWSQREPTDMKDFQQFGNQYLDLVLPESLPNNLFTQGREFGISGMGQNNQTRYLSMGYMAQLKQDKPDHWYSYNLRAQFTFEFKDGRWIMLDLPVFNPERFVDEAPKVFERKLLVENPDIKSLVDYINAHKDDAFDSAMSTHPMAPLVNTRH